MVMYYGNIHNKNLTRLLLQESRDTRIKQYQEEADSHTVLALREGSLLLVEGATATVIGSNSARLYEK